MLVRQSFYAGLLISAALLVAALVGVFWRGFASGLTSQIFPALLAPLVVTGIVAVRRATPWIGGPTQATLAGALAGLMSALLAVLIFYLATFINIVFLGLNTTHWDGFVSI